MYKAFTASEFKDRFNLEPDYSVKGFLCYGAWDTEKQFGNLTEALGKMFVDFSYKKLEGFLSNIYELSIGGNKYWFTVMYGGAMLSELVHLASLFGSEKNIHIGSCGGLYPDINSLDLIVPEWSYGNESTTRAYEPEALGFKHFSNKELSRKILSEIPKEYKVYTGPLITNQAMMGETWDHVKKWSEDGFYGVEMESATIFSVSNHFKVPCAALVYVSDNLIKGQTTGDESHIKEREKREMLKIEVYTTALKVLIT